MPVKKTHKKMTAKKPAAKQDMRLERFFGRVSRLTRGWWLVLWVALLLGAFALQALTAMVQKSGTWDETAHLPAGYSYLKTGDFRMNAEHPPLAKMIAGMPLLFLNLDGAFETEAWQQGAEWEYGWELLYSGRNDAYKIFFWGRLPMVVLGLCLGLLIFFWARKIYGNGAGLFALFLFAFCPNLIAHSQLTNTDAPIALFLLLSLYCFVRAARRLTPLNAALAGVTLGLALLAKFSGALMLPILAVTALVRVFDRSPIEVRFLKAPNAADWRAKLIVLIILFAVMLPVAWGVIWAGYGFRFDARADGAEKELWFGLPHDKPSGLYKLALDKRLLPQAYVEGFSYVRQTMTRASFLDGEHNWTPGKNQLKPWPHYFIMTSLYKTPVPALLLLLVAAAMAFRWSRKTWRQEVPLAAAFVIYFGVAVFGNMNIGHRHILPVIPLAFIFVGKIVNHLRGREITDTAVCVALFGILLLWYVFGAATIWPHYLAYFNEIAGGPGNGPKHLTDSNIDWGQDLILLKRYMDENRIKDIYLIYFGSADPRCYGINQKTENLKAGDYIAISVTNLQETYNRDNFAKWLREEGEKNLQAKIGYSIYVYKVPPILEQLMQTPPPKESRNERTAP